jgi:hypothetical protein
MCKFLPLIIHAISFFPIQLNSPAKGAAEVVVVVAAGVTTEVTGATGATEVTGVAVVADHVHTTVTVLQARRTHLHSD